MSRKFVIFYASTVGVTLYLSLVFSIVQAINRIDLPVDSEIEALRISARRPVVQRTMLFIFVVNRDIAAEGYRFTYELKSSVRYWTSEKIRNMKEKYPSISEYSSLPDDHGVWRVNWWTRPSIVDIIHYIDEFSGEIIWSDVFSHA